MARLRNTIITIFVIFWTVLFHYESTRSFFLEPLFKHQLPKFKFLFPPAGWIMFYNVSNGYGFVEVYGVKGQNLQLIDPHEILHVRTIGFDNVHRNVLSTVVSPRLAEPFCRYLERRFPYFDKFVVTSVYYPDLIKEPFKRLQQIAYECTANE